MSRQVYFFTTGGFYVTSEVRDVLLHVGRELARASGKKHSEKTSAADVMVTTEHRRASIGTIPEVVFEAVIEDAYGRHDLRYLIEDSILEGPDDFEMTYIQEFEERSRSSCWN